VLHGNGSSAAPSFSQVALGSDVSGTLGISNGGTGAGTATISPNLFSAALNRTVSKAHDQAKAPTSMSGVRERPQKVVLRFAWDLYLLKATGSLWVRPCFSPD
jgi:hypothetical protein